MKRYNLPPKAHLHFVGVGGIGMSALAQLCHLKGFTVSGCDTNSNTITKRLCSLGCNIEDHHDAAHARQANYIIYSSAISKDHPERVFAARNGIPELHRAQLLQALSCNQQVIAVTGSHGKTTTSAILGHIFISAEQNPTVLVGGILENLQTNSFVGNSNTLIIEADESDRSMLALFPSQILITNTDREHLSTYQDLDDIQQAFIAFTNNTPKHATIYLSGDDPPTQALTQYINRHIVTFGCKAQNDYQAHTISEHAHYTKFFINEHGPFALSLPGKHNLLNATGAIAIALEHQLPIASIVHAIKTFQGVKRRLEPKGWYNGAKVIDDYAHHPTELACTLTTARHLTSGKLIAAFQPQRYSRTAQLWQEFVSILAYAPYDHLFIMDIYPAGEMPQKAISSKKLVQAIRNKRPSASVSYVQEFTDLTALVTKLLEPDDLLLTLGAGKLYQFAETLTSTTP